MSEGVRQGGRDSVGRMGEIQEVMDSDVGRGREGDSSEAVV